jgi:plastocyanin
MILHRPVTLAALVLALAGPARAEDVPAGPVVRIENFTFNPSKLTIKPGTTVTVENADDIPHSVVDKDGKFRSKPLDTGDRFTMTFSDPGVITYFCGFHPHMVGKIIVKP